MSGHVFHPGHEELHGVTVVVEGPNGRTWVGRYHERSERGVLLHDVATYDAATIPENRETWISRQVKFGVRIDARRVLIPTGEAGRIVPLMDWAPQTA